MLETLEIRNLALIEDLYIEFDKGFTVLTGETGAGKSIILGALNLILGERADASFVRSGSAEATVSATLSIAEEHTLHSWLKEREIEVKGESLVVRRVLKSSGRSSNYLQSAPVTLSDLKVVAQALFDIHGQHEHQSLLHSERQRVVLDSYSSLEKRVSSFSELYKEYLEAKKRVATLEEEAKKSLLEIDYLTFVLEELTQAQLKVGEDTTLEEEISLLSQYELIQESLESSYSFLKGGRGEGTLSTLGGAIASLQKIKEIDSTLAESSERLESALLEIEDITTTLRDRLSSLSFSQEKLDQMQSRLALIQRLKKKYGPSLEAVLEHQKSIQSSIDSIENQDERLLEAKSSLEALWNKITDESQLITELRKKGAASLQEPIKERLRLLGMPNVDFTIEVNQRALGPSGSDQIEFLFSANLGEPLRSLKEIASGGELSRVMLALKAVFSEADDIDTLIFDEVDAGIGGAVAVSVATQMRELASKRQVIVITHLASIASKADKHLLVHKEESKGRTFTLIQELNQNQRVKEIARMLSGSECDEKALQHAHSLLER